MIRNYEYKMAGPYSDVKTKVVVVIYEHTVDGADVPCYNVIEQEEFDGSRDQLTRETLEFC